MFLDFGFSSTRGNRHAAALRACGGTTQVDNPRRSNQGTGGQRLGVVQPRISQISCNKVDKLSLDYLVGLCAKAGVTVALKLAV